MKLAVVVTDNLSAWSFRASLLKAAVDRGLDTYILTPSGDCDDLLASLGVTHVPIRVDRFISPILDMAFLLQLTRIFQSMKFDIVHNVSIKPNIYGAIAAGISHVPTVVGSITGLGTAFDARIGLGLRTVNSIIRGLYRLAFRITDRVWFQNCDDIDYFVDSRMIAKEKTVLIRSSGVDVTRFSSECIDRHDVDSIRRDIGLSDNSVVVSMVARTLVSKGVKEFIKAAELTGKIFPSAKFLLIGNGEKGNSQNIPPDFLLSKQSDHFLWLGWRDDIREILSLSDIAVLPSLYREGTPKSLLEAMAMGKPIVTSDVPGCREVAEDGKNGYIVPPGDVRALARAIDDLIRDPSKRTKWGAYSRYKVETEFDQRQVNERILRELYQV